MTVLCCYMDIPHVKPNQWQNSLSSAAHWLCSAQGFCSFSDFKEQTVHPEGLSGFCGKLPPAPCALLCSHCCCWLQPRHQPNLPEAFSSGSSVCSKCNYIVFGKHIPDMYIWIYWEINMEQQCSSPNFSINTRQPFPSSLQKSALSIAGDAQSPFSSEMSLLCTKWF